MFYVVRDNFFHDARNTHSAGVSTLLIYILANIILLDSTKCHHGVRLIDRVSSRSLQTNYELPLFSATEILRDLSGFRTERDSMGFPVFSQPIYQQRSHSSRHPFSAKRDPGSQYTSSKLNDITDRDTLFSRMANICIGSSISRKY